MDQLDRLSQALHGVQTLLGELIAQAAKEGDFRMVADLAARGRELGDLMCRWASENGDGNSLEISATAEQAHRRPASKETGRDTFSEYPRFFREAGELVKLGWSQTARTTYEHRAAKPVVDSIVKRLVTIGENGHRFSMDRLLIASPKNGGRNSHPSYQVYAVVAWLKWCGLLIQHGRQGYTVANPKAFAESSATAWNALPRR